MQLFLPDIILAQCDLQIFALLTFCCVSHRFLCIQSTVLVVASFTLHAGSALFEERDTSHFGAD